MREKRINFCDRNTKRHWFYDRKRGENALTLEIEIQKRIDFTILIRLKLENKGKNA